MADSTIEDNYPDDNNNACSCKQDTPRASNFLRKYSIEDMSIDLLDQLQEAERGTHLRWQEFDIALALHDRAGEYEDECAAALLTAMVVAQCKAKVLDEKEKKVVEEWKRIQLSVGAKDKMKPKQVEQAQLDLACRQHHGS